MSIAFDRVKFTTATTGTGAITVAAQVTDPVNGDCLTPAQAGVPDGTTVSYVAISGNSWAKGQGTTGSSGTVLARDPSETCWNGSTFGAGPLALTGTSTVFLTELAEDLAAPWLSAAASTPASGSVALGVALHGGFETPAWQGAHGVLKTPQRCFGRGFVMMMTAEYDTTNFVSYGASGAPGSSGTGTAKTLATTNYQTSQPTMQWAGTATGGTGSSVFLGNTTNSGFILGTGTGVGSPGVGGGLFIFRFAINDTIANGTNGPIGFWGLSTTSSPSMTTDPSTLTNSIGIIHSQLVANPGHLYFMVAGASSQTSVDLTSNFPANNGTDFYELHISSDPITGVLNYAAYRWTTSVAINQIASGSVNTNLPASTIKMFPIGYRSNGSAGTTAASWLFSSIYMEG